MNTLQIMLLVFLLILIPLCFKKNLSNQEFLKLEYEKMLKNLAYKISYRDYLFLNTSYNIHTLNYYFKQQVKMKTILNVYNNLIFQNKEDFIKYELVIDQFLDEILNNIKPDKNISKFFILDYKKNVSKIYKYIITTNNKK